MKKRNKLFVWESSAVAVLLTAFFLMALSSLLLKSPTFDEPVFIAGGANAWRNNDYRINPEGCQFPGRWVSLPAALCPGVKFPAVAEFPNQDQWFLSWLFIYNSGNSPAFILVSARIMTLIAGVFLGLLVFFISRSYFGPLGALISLCFYSFSPAILAHSRLAVSDLIVAFMFLSAAWSVWLAFQRLSISRIFLAALALTLLFLSKMSAFFFVPMFLIMFVFRLLYGGGLVLRLPKSKEFIFNSRLKQFGVLTVFAFFLGCFVYLGIWTSYGFRYSMLSNGKAGGAMVESAWKAQIQPDFIGDSIQFARKHKLFPEAFLYGFAFTYRHSRYRLAFLNGSYCGTGWWCFFPYAFMVKTPLPFLGFLFVLFISWLLWLWYLKKKSSMSFRFSVFFDSLYKYAPLWILIFVYAAFAISSNLNIGHRHILVLYPPLFIFAGSISSLMLVFNKKFFNGAVFVLLALFIIDSLRIWPDYLAYFNILAGGPENAYEHLVDSSLDWGQDAHALQRRLKARGLTRNDVYLSFFGSMPYREFGIKARKLPCFFEQRQDEIFPLKGGVYCISATMLKLMPYPCLTQCGDLKNARFKACRKELSALFDAASDPEKVKRIVKEKGGENIRRIYAVYELLRFARLCRYLDNRLPDENVGYSILIFNLSDEEVQEALGDHR